MKIVNLTPHVLNLAGTEFSPSGQVARVSVSRKKIGKIGGVPCFLPVFGEVADLPDADGESLFVVSALVRTHPAVKDREDVASPGAPVRDSEGKITGADGLDFSLAFHALHTWGESVTFGPNAANWAQALVNTDHEWPGVGSVTRI